MNRYLIMLHFFNIIIPFVYKSVQDASYLCMICLLTTKTIPNPNVYPLDDILKELLCCHDEKESNKKKITTINFLENK